MIHRGLILGGLLALLPVTSQAALMLMIEGVPGPTKLSGYAGWFNADDYTVGVDRPNTAKPQALAVSLEDTAAVAALFQVAAGMGTFKKIVLDVLDTGFDPSKPTLLSRLTCEEATLRAIASRNSGEDHGRSELQFTCGRMIWEGFDYDNSTKGLVKTSKGTWNFKTNTP